MTPSTNKKSAEETRKGEPMDESEFDFTPGTAAAEQWAKVEEEFQRDWQKGPDRNRVTWEHASWAYRFGWQAAGSTGVREKPMDEVEFDGLLAMARRAWERRRASM